MWQDGDLLGDEEAKVGSSQLEPRHEVANKTGQESWQGATQRQWTPLLPIPGLLYDPRLRWGTRPLPPSARWCCW